MGSVLTVDLGNSSCKLRLWEVAGDVAGVAASGSLTASVEFGVDADLVPEVAAWLTAHPGGEWRSPVRCG